MEHARLISIAQKVIHKFGKDRQLTLLRGLFEGAQYNSEAWAKCAVYSRARTKQGRGVIKEIRYTHTNMDTNINHLPHSHCMCGIMNVVFRSTSVECGRPFDVKVIWFKYTFILLPFFLPIMIVPLSWLGWRGLPHLSGIPY